MSQPDPAIVVIGAGVVGLSTALYLRRSGRDVVVIDPLPPPGGASFGNAGMISADTSVPIALPGMLRKVPSWLTDPLGPLAVRPSYFPKALPWLLKWIAAGRMPRVLEISDAMRALHKDAFACWKELLGPENFADLVRPAGQVHVWEADGESESAALERKLRERQGIASQTLGFDDLRQMFPGISPAVRRGVLVPGNGYTVSPQRIVQTLHRLFLEAGGRLRARERDEDPAARGRRLRCHDQCRLPSRPADRRRSRRALGSPARAARHPRAARDRARLPRHAADAQRFADHDHLEQEPFLRRHADGAWAQGGGHGRDRGLEAAPDERRAKALLANVRTMFPDVNTDGHRFWMGFRPSTPDSLPMLGEATGRPGLFLAVGHGHFGMTGGPPSGRLIAQLINGKPTAIDASAYAPQRFA